MLSIRAYLFLTAAAFDYIKKKLFQTLAAGLDQRNFGSTRQYFMHIGLQSFLGDILLDNIVFLSWSKTYIIANNPFLHDLVNPFYALEFTLENDTNPITDCLDIGGYMCTEKNAFPTRLQIKHDIFHKRPPHRIKTAHRFIKNVHIRVMDKHLCQSQPLHHPLAVAANSSLPGIPQLQKF